MRYNVPKYIDIKDKIFGPLTFKQFVYLIGGGGLSIVIFWLSPSTIISLFLIPMVAAFSLALAFWNYNGKPFIYTVQAVFSYLTNARTYVWQRQEHEDKDSKQLQKELEQIEETMAEKNNDTIGRKSAEVTVGADGEGRGQTETINDSS